jgi:hypothetical protein
MPVNDRTRVLQEFLFRDAPITYVQLRKSLFHMGQQNLDATLEVFKEAGMLDQNSKGIWFMPPSIRKEFMDRFKR